MNGAAATSSETARENDRDRWRAVRDMSWLLRARRHGFRPCPNPHTLAGAGWIGAARSIAVTSTTRSGALGLGAGPAAGAHRAGLVGQARAGLLPQIGPGAPVVELGSRIGLAARHKGGKPRPPGGLADRLVAQIERPAHPLTLVAQRRVHRAPVQEDGAAALHRHWEAAGASDLLRDAQVERLPRLGR